MSEMAGVETIYLPDMIESWDLACDWAEYNHVTHTEVVWAGHTSPCGCGVAGVIVLLCDLCHNAVLHSEDGAVECHKCGEVTAPARAVFTRFERL